MSRRGALFAASLLVFAAVFAVHGYVSMFPPPDPELSRWATVVSPTFSDRFGGYFSSGALWVGYCYGLAAGFALFSAGLFLLERRGRGFALGGVTFSGALAAGACFMTGCCGSPMLGVWVSLLGASSAKWLGPFAAFVSTVSVVWAAYGFSRRGASSMCSCSCKCEG